MKIERIALLILCVILVTAGTISQITTFQDGNVLTASQLNNEFGQIISTINSLDNDNIASGANINPSKIDPSIAGDGIAVATGVLAVNDDDSTLTIVGDVLQMKDDGTTGAKLAAAVAGSGLVQDGSGNLDVNPDNVGVEISGDAVQLKDLGVTTAKLNNDAVTTGKIATGAVQTTDIADDNVTQAKLENKNVTTNGSDPGAGGLVYSSSCGTYSNATTGYTDVTNLSVTLTTTGRPVMLMVVADGTNASGLGCQFGAIGQTTRYPDAQFAFLRGAGIISENRVGKTSRTAETAGLADEIRVPGSSFMYVDNPAAGTYTYKVQGKSNKAATAQAIAQDCRLLAYEL